MPTSDSGGWRGDDDGAGHVSPRFLTTFVERLEGQGIDAKDLVGDLPIPIEGPRLTVEPIEWPTFVELVKRLEYELGGNLELEDCGAAIAQPIDKPRLRHWLGWVLSPYLLFRIAGTRILPRSLPGLESRVVSRDGNQLEIHIRIAAGLRPSPQLFGLLAGVARVLPDYIGCLNAVVDYKIEPSEARYRIALPPSSTLLARSRRLARALISAGSVVRALEAKQLELRAKHDSLRRQHDDLTKDAGRLQAFIEASIDVLCEVDVDGHIRSVNSAVEDLIGYTQEQIVGSHFRLWVPRVFHHRANTLFDLLMNTPHGTAIPRELVALHSADGRKIIVEVSVRSFLTSSGERRFACVLRDLSDVFATRTDSPQDARTTRVTQIKRTTRTDRLRGVLSGYHRKRGHGKAPQIPKSDSENAPRTHPLESR